MNDPGDSSHVAVALVTATPDEAEAISSMAARIWPEAYGPILPREQIDYMLGWMYAPEHLRREMLDVNIVYFWIERGSERVGFLALGPIDGGSARPLHKFYLLPEAQGLGTGSRAMSLLLSRLARALTPSIELRVNRNNAAAIGFYRKNGFVVYGEDRREIGGGFVMDDFLMRRELAS